MTKTTTILAFSVVLALVIGIVSSGTIVEAAKPPESLPAAVCPAVNVQHWETISWVSGVFIEHPTLASIERGILKTQVDINTVYNYNELAAALNNLGYLNSGNPITASDIVFSTPQADPQIICAES